MTPSCTCGDRATHVVIERVTGRRKTMCEEHATLALDRDGERGVLVRRLSDAERHQPLHR